MHGDEVFGLKILGKLSEHLPGTLAVRVGHPEAIAKRRRYLETDLNRSFRSEQQTIESSLANEITADIKRFAPDCIIDIHTSTSTMPTVGIAAKLTPTTLYAAQRLGMQALVIMPERIARNSLIGAFPDTALSIEYGKHQRSDVLAVTTAQHILSLAAAEQRPVLDIPIYHVTSTIAKDFHALDGIKNLSYNQELEGYPFLAGKNTYPDIGGFLAQKLSP